MATQAQPLESTTNVVIDPWLVVLLNDEIHTFDEVITQLVRATGCSTDRAEEIAMEVHTQGSSICFTGSMERCELVASILEEINLRVRLEPA